MFLQNYEIATKTRSDYSRFFPADFGDEAEKATAETENAKSGKVDSREVFKREFFQPYTDSPTDSEEVGEHVYLQTIYAAKKYLYITTPYLIIDGRMADALTLAAKSGVDVRIITPGHGDKKFVHNVTRSYYKQLIEGGVKIYEYSRGFIHSKTFVADDKVAIVGTTNLDYRSLYHHFENAAAFYHKDAVAGVKADFDHIFEECHEVTEQYRSHRSTALRIGQCILRLFAPLL